MERRDGNWDGNELAIEGLRIFLEKLLNPGKLALGKAEFCRAYEISDLFGATSAYDSSRYRRVPQGPRDSNLTGTATMWIANIL